MNQSKESVLFADYTHNFWTGCRKISDGCIKPSSPCFDATIINTISDTTFNKPTKLAGKNTCIYSYLYATIKYIQINIRKGK
jgi:hypothetical protein